MDVVRVIIIITIITIVIITIIVIIVIIICISIIRVWLELIRAVGGIVTQARVRQHLIRQQMGVSKKSAFVTTVLQERV